MGKPVFRASPGCERACAACDVRCAILAGEAYDAWRDAERLRRQPSPSGPELAASLTRAEARLADAERAFAQARRAAPEIIPAPAWSRTCGSMLLH